MSIVSSRAPRPDLTIIGAPMPDGVLAYLATPYTDYRDGHEIAFRDAAQISGALTLSGVDNFSPIGHFHPAATYGGIETLDAEFWQEKCLPFMQRCEVLIVAQMKGWKESKGVQHEINFFIERKRTIFMLDPVTMSMRNWLTTAAALPSVRAAS